MVNKTEKKVWNLQKAFSLRTIKICRFEIIDGVKYVYCVKHAYKFLLREQVGLAAVFDACINVLLVALLHTQTVSLCVKFCYVQV